MNKYWILIVGVVFSFSLPASEKLTLLLPDRLTYLENDTLPHELLFTDGGISLVQVDVAKAESWSRKVHEMSGTCGGYLDVSWEIAHGMAPTKLVWDEIQRRESPTDDIVFNVRGSREIEALVAKADGDKIWEHLGALTAFADRSASSEQGLKAAEFLQVTANRYAKNRTDLKTFTVATNSFFYNKQPSVIVSITGTDPNAEHVVVGAHFDTLSTQKPGADDDGSGSAVVMEALRVIAESGAKFKHSIDFIWYAAEERGLLGSQSVVRYFAAQKIPVKAALQFDMVGFKSPDDEQDIYLLSDYTHANLNTALHKIVTMYVTPKVGTTECGYACSDHASWTKGGIPATYPFESTSENMNHTLHTAKDTLALLDKAHTLKFAKIALAFLGEIAELH